MAVSCASPRYFASSVAAALAPAWRWLKRLKKVEV